MTNYEKNVRTHGGKSNQSRNKNVGIYESYIFD